MIHLLWLTFRWDSDERVSNVFSGILSAEAAEGICAEKNPGESKFHSQRPSLHLTRYSLSAKNSCYILCFVLLGRYLER